ncbi:MAG: ABC transporter ATP-binding protein [Deltaproteobacteria bacterium]|nr:ABC transporter ATP-binding protein [Deltaproteobacteria bacterium]
MIRLQKINKSYEVGGRPLHVLKDLDLAIDDGEFLSIMGASGSGKSTLLNIIGILDGYDSGEYHFDGTTMRGLTERKAAWFRNRQIGFVFQSFHLLPFKNAMENVALPLYYRRVSRRKRNQIAMSYLEKVGLADRADHVPAQLSGGEQQRVAIARALVTRPRLVLADEPTGALDSQTSNDLLALLQRINEEGISIAVVTHEADISQMTRRIVRLHDGRIVDDVLN